jgi:hypothetical protein
MLPKISGMVLIFSEKYSPRLDYTARLIFSGILGTEVALTHDPDHFRKAEGPKINYSLLPLEDELFLKAAPLLFSDQIVLPEIHPVTFGAETGFFETSPDSFLPFDPLASAFLMVSRLEEYLPGSRDRYGRFPAAASILFRYGLLEKAVVNRWARLIAGTLQERYGDFSVAPRAFNFLPTIDVDNAWAYLHKGFFRTTAAFARDLMKGNTGELTRRFRVLAGRGTDPYFTFPYLTDMYREFPGKVPFFFLLGNYSRFDKAVSWRNGHFRRLIAGLHDRFPAGIHPSWRSSLPGRFQVLQAEKERLEAIIGEKVVRSRQHYLRLSLPETYQQLISAGIGEDYSMGYPDMPGFRAGICTPFLFYDLAREKTTSLRVFPFQVMDVTFMQYLGSDPEETISRVKTIMEEIKFAGGTFCAVWHNESLCEKGKWKGFRKVFEEMNQTGFTYGGRP